MYKSIFIIFGCLLTISLCDDVENLSTSIDPSSIHKEGGQNSSCSPLLGHCNRNDQCCKPYVCLTYLAKCVTGNIDPSEVHKEEEGQDLSCSPLHGHCNRNDQCCKPYVCLTYLAKCVTGNLAEAPTESLVK